MCQFLLDLDYFFCIGSRFQDAPYFKVSRFFRAWHSLEKAQVYEAFDSRVHSALESAFVCARRQEGYEQFAHLVLSDRAFPSIEMRGLELVESLAQEDAEHRCVIAEMVAPCQSGQHYRLTIVVFDGWLMQIGLAIL